MSPKWRPKLAANVEDQRENIDTEHRRCQCQKLIRGLASQNLECQMKGSSVKLGTY